MFYREAIINDVLCCKTSQNGNWKPFTKEELTKRLVMAESRIQKCYEALTKCTTA